MQLHEIFNCPQHEALLTLLGNAHYSAAMSNDNTSSAVAVAVYMASGSIDNAILAASMAQGHLHAPIAAARRWFSFHDPRAAAEYIKSKKWRLPGFGNSFYKTGIDPAFKPVYDALPHAQLEVIHKVNLAVPTLWPNAAIITAAVCEAAQLPHGCENLVFTRCRSPAWTKLCMERQLPAVATP